MTSLVKFILLPLVTLLLAIHFYPSSIVHTVSIDNIPSNPHYPYYLVLYPGETLVGTITAVPASVVYLEVRNTVYDKWEPRVLAKDAFGQCTFSESIKCNGTVALIDSVYIQATVEHFNLNSTDAIHLARAYENAGQSDKALSIYRALSGFFPKYRTAVINMDMGAFLAVYHEFPHRKEPLYYLARHYRTLGNYSECLLYARAGMLIGSPVATDTFIEKPIYGYGLELEFAHCLYYAGRPMEAVNQWKRVLPSMPTKLASELTANLGSILGNQ